MKNIISVLLLASFGIFQGDTIVSAQSDFRGQQSLCTASLVANNPNARINLRSGPGTNFKSLGYGLVGDYIYILATNPPEADYAKDRQGYFWYRVGFPRSGAQGWIREDFLKKFCQYD